jgi:WD40 repeat protein
VVILDLAGRIIARTAEWNSQQGLAWSANGREVWYSASQDNASSDIRALSRSGREHVVTRLGGTVLLQDIAPNGQVLLQYEHFQSGIRGRTDPQAEERELGWFDFPVAADLSADGRSLLFAEEGMYGGALYAVCLRGMDGSPPVKLGEGRPCALSPDGKWALAIHFGPPSRLLLLPTGPGDSASLPRGSIDKYYEAGWLPDGKSIVFSGSEKGREQRTYLQELRGGPPRAITPEGIAGTRVSPDGRFVAAVSKSSRLHVYPVGGGKAEVILDLKASESPCQWSADGKSLYVRSRGTHMSISRVELATGKKVPWRMFNLPDPAGSNLFGAVLTPDGRSYAYTYFRTLSDLYLVNGLK